MRKIITLGISCLLCLAVFSFFATGTDISHQGGNCALKKYTSIQSYISHKPVRINSNSDFNIGTNGVVSGTGKPDDPYVLKSWFINAAGSGNAIYIGNTTVFFSVQNCNLENATHTTSQYNIGAGVQLYNTWNGTLKLNHYIGNYYGICLNSTSHANKIQFNEISTSTHDGIHLDRLTRNNAITYNNISNSGNDGISLLDVNSTTISTNNISSNSNNGISLIGSIGNYFMDNIITQNSNCGVSGSSSSNHNILYNNNVSTNSVDGIYFIQSISNIIQDNVVYQNQMYGIHSDTCNDSVILYNNVERNLNNGIYAFTCGNLRINHNNASYNSQSGIFLDTYSNGNILMNNDVYLNTQYGIRIYYYSNNNKIIFNNISSNNNYGLGISRSPTGNRIFYNCFYNNMGTAVQAQDGNGNNFWNSSEMRGNFWSDYTTRYPSATNNGIYWSIPYAIDGTGPSLTSDNYPLVNITDKNQIDPHPFAYIDSISPNPSSQNQVITFQGHGTTTVGSIIGYYWRSNLDGNLSKSASFSISMLSPGIHTIYFQVENSNNTLSPEVSKTLSITQSTSLNLLQVTATSTPSIIKAGGGISTISVHVTNKSSGIGIPGASVSGSLNPMLGSLGTFADSGGGDYAASYTPPTTIGVSTIITITVTAAITGYQSNSNLTTVTVQPSSGTMTYSISGNVFRSGTSTPVIGATLTLNPGVKVTTTNNTGFYQYTKLVNGTYTLSITRSGYITNSTGFSISGSNISMDIFLDSGSGTTYSIIGHVYQFGTTQSINYATISISPGTKSTYTDTSGFYQITGLANNTYNLTVTKTGYQQSIQVVTISGSSVTKDIFLNIQPSTTYEVSGHVYLVGTKQTISSVLIKIDPGAKQATTDTAGYYDVTGLGNGSYSITVFKTGYNINTTVISISGANLIEDVYLTPGSGVSTYAVYGYVYKVNTTQPIANATILVSKNSKSAISNAIGYYIISGLVNGSYSITVSKSGYQNSVVNYIISGANQKQNVEMKPTTSGGNQGNKITLFGLELTSLCIGLIVICVIVFVVLLVILIGVRRRNPHVIMVPTQAQSSEFDNQGPMQQPEPVLVAPPPMEEPISYPPMASQPLVEEKGVPKEEIPPPPETPTEVPVVAAPLVTEQPPVEQPTPEEMPQEEEIAPEPSIIPEPITTEEPKPPIEEPKPPVEEPEVPIEEPKPLVEEPEPPVEEPKPPVEEPKPPVEEPEPPIEEPKPTVEEPKPPVEEPKPSVEEPKPVAEEPKKAEEPVKEEYKKPEEKVVGQQKPSKKKSKKSKKSKRGTDTKSSKDSEVPPPPDD